MMTIVRWFAGVLVGVLIGAAAAILVMVVMQERDRYPPPSEREIANEVLRGLVAYGEDYGELPLNGAWVLLSPLQGENPRRMNFVENDRIKADSRGRVVNSIGRPFIFVDSGNYLILVSLHADGYSDSAYRDSAVYFSRRKD